MPQRIYKGYDGGDNMTKIDLMSRKSQYITEVYGIEVKEVEVGHHNDVRLKWGGLNTDKVLFEMSLSYDSDNEKAEDVLLRAYDQVINYMSEQR